MDGELQGGDVHASADEDPGLCTQRTLRLSDAERIATDRLDGATEGSLKEALATSIPVLEPCGLRLTERIEQIRRLTETVTPLRSFHAAPSARLGWEEAVPPAHAMPAASHEDPSGSLLLPSNDLLPAPCLDAAWEQAWSACQMPPADDAGPPAHEALPAEDMEEAPVRGLIALEQALDEQDGASDAKADAPGHDAGLPTALPAHMLEAARAQAVEPLVTAFAANARLAADATAASHALHHLKKLLAEKMEMEEEASVSGLEPQFGFDTRQATQPTVEAQEAERATPAPAPQPTEPVSAQMPAPVAEAAPTVGPPTVPSPPLTSPAVVLAAVKPPSVPPPIPMPAVALRPRPTNLVREPAAEELPQCVQGQPRFYGEERARKPERPVIAEVPVALKPKPDLPVPLPQVTSQAVRTKSRQVPPRVTRPERVTAPLDVGGFIAGFALSGAIGVVLYFVMTAS